MTDQPDEFFRPGITYTVNPNGIAPEIRAEFICHGVGINPRNGEKRAFGFYRAGAFDDWFSTALRAERWTDAEWWPLCTDPQCPEHAGYTAP
jgi:hypothetical protein